MTELIKDGYAVLSEGELIAVFSEEEDAEEYIRRTYTENDNRTLLHVFFGVEAF